jgi:peptide alpha-N-acetyltransferase
MESLPETPLFDSDIIETFPYTLGDLSVSVAISKYHDETQIEALMKMMAKELSEPYSIFTYRYFLNQWPDYCLLAHADKKLVGAIVCKIEDRTNPLSGQIRKRGYIAMLAIEVPLRKSGLGTKLSSIAIERLCKVCDEIVLETEETNIAALRLYERLGFLREKKLPKYYMNGNDAYRLKLWINEP